MGKLILKDAYLEVDGVDLSNRANTVGIPMSTDDVNLDTFGSEFHQHGQGLKDGSITATFIQDLDAGSVNATLWPLATSGDSFAVVVRARAGAAVSATNPEWTLAEAVLFDYNPLGASVGEAATTDVTFQNAGDAGIAMATA